MLLSRLKAGIPIRPVHFCCCCCSSDPISRQYGLTCRGFICVWGHINDNDLWKQVNSLQHVVNINHSCGWHTTQVCAGTLLGPLLFQSIFFCLQTSFLRALWSMCTGTSALIRTQREEGWTPFHSCKSCFEFLVLHWLQIVVSQGKKSSRFFSYLVVNIRYYWTGSISPSAATSWKFHAKHLSQKSDIFLFVRVKAEI